jgi:hypothetical protein
MDLTNDPTLNVSMILCPTTVFVIVPAVVPAVVLYVHVSEAHGYGSGQAFAGCARTPSLGTPRAAGYSYS